MGLKRQGLSDRRDVHPKPPVIPCSQVPRLARSGSVSLHEDTHFQAQPGCVCPHLDPVAFPLLFSMGPTELPPQSRIQKHNGFM